MEVANEVGISQPQVSPPGERGVEGDAELLTLRKRRIFECANERIPRRARKSAFLGIVRFARYQKFLACQMSPEAKI